MKLQDLFAKAAHANAKKIAVEFYDENGTNFKITYEKLVDTTKMLQVYFSNHPPFKEKVFPSNNLVQTIGIFCKPNAFIPALILGILEAGCAFAFLDPSTPRKKNNLFLKTAGINCVLLKKAWLGPFEQLCSGYIVSKHPLCNDYDEENEEWLVCRLTHDCSYTNMFPPKFDQAHDLAYVISTSGTTGLPKIVHVPHACIVPNVLHLMKLFALSPNDKVALITPLTFDPSVIEMFVALGSGATLVVISDSVKFQPSVLIHTLCSAAEVTVLQTTPSVFHLMHDAGASRFIFGMQSKVRLLAIGGEACPPCKILRNWVTGKSDTKHVANLASKQFEFFNLYGITELSVWATYYKVPFDDISHGLVDAIPLGLPLHGTFLGIYSQDTDKLLCEIASYGKSDSTVIDECAIVNFHEEVKPSQDNDHISLQGFLWVGGKQRCCHVCSCSEHDSRTPEACARQMTTATGEILSMRNTGDIVRLVLKSAHLQEKIFKKSSFYVNCNAQYELTYIGRSDSQIKRHGKKMNLMCVKSALEQLDTVRVSHVIYCSDPKEQNATSAVDQKLLAFLVPALHCISEATRRHLKMQVWQYLSETLEKHCIPDDIIFVQKLPVNSHGKVDESVLLETLQFRSDNSSPFHYGQSKMISLSEVETMFYKCWMSCLAADTSVMLSSEQTKKKTFVQLGGDSYRAVRLVYLVESNLPAQCQVPDLLDNVLRKTFSEAVTYIFKCMYKSEWYSADNEPNMKRKFSDHMKIAGKESTKRCCTSEFPRATRTFSEKGISHTRCGKLFYHGSVRMRNMLPCPSFPLKSWRLKQYWCHNTGKCVDASPLLVVKENKNSFVIIGSHSFYIACVDYNLGNTLWRMKIGGRIESSACLTPCGRYVVVGCYDKCVYFLEAKDGEILWKFETGGEVKSSPCPGLQDTSVVYVGSHDGALYALDAHTKAVKWKLVCGESAVFSSPCFHCYYDGSRSFPVEVVTTCTLSGKVISVDATSGHTRWTTNLEKPVFSSPLMCDLGTCVGCVDSKMYMMDNDNGVILWSYSCAQPIFSSPALAPIAAESSKNRSAVVFGSHDGCTYCLDAKNGQLLWKYPVVDEKALPPVYSSPCPFEIYVLGDGNAVGKHQLVATASTDGVVRVLELERGRLVAQQRLPGHVFSSPVVVARTPRRESSTAAVSHACSVLVGCRDNNLYRLDLVEVTDGRDSPRPQIAQRTANNCSQPVRAPQGTEGGIELL